MAIQNYYSSALDRYNNDMPSNSNQYEPVTLTRLTALGRKAVKYGAIGLVALMVLRFSATTFIEVWRALNPPPPPPPTVGFGALPPIEFPTASEDDRPEQFRLETATGRLPTDFPDRAKVFFMPVAEASLLDDADAKSLANEFGFALEPEQLDGRTYRWRRATPLNATLEMDIREKTFTLETDYLSRTELLLDNEVPTSQTATQRLKQFLSSGGVIGQDIATVSGDITYLRSLGGEAAPAVSLSDADFIQVDLRRAPIDSQYSFYTPEGEKGIISGVVFGALSGGNNIVSLENKYRRIDYSSVETYPLRPVRQAWDALQAGEGYVAAGDGDTAVIREVELGYFDSYDLQEYMRPVYVFKGDDGFIAYTAALAPEVLTTAPDTESDTTDE